MPTYILLSTLTDEGAETLKYKPERLKKVNEELKALGAEVKEQYATLGPYDFVNIVEAPDNATIARVSIELSSRGQCSYPDSAGGTYRRLHRKFEVTAG